MENDKQAHKSFP